MNDEAGPCDPRAWRRTLDEMRPLAVELIEQPSGAAAHRPLQADEHAEARYWATAFVSRIDAALAALRAFVPFIDISWPSVEEGTPVAACLHDLNEAAVGTPALNDLDDHYDGLERRVRDCLTAAGTRSASVSASLGQFLEQVATARAAARLLVADLHTVAARAASIAIDADFTFLFDQRRKLLRVGYTVDSGELDPSCYGLLASEARTAVFLAIAKHDIPREAWFHLGRKLTSYRDCRVLLSWSGSMFEYAMPALFMKSYDHTLLGTSVRRAVQVQQLYARERRVPWGISEAAYSGSDGVQERRYQAFGVPGLAMKRLRSSDLVVAPYATLLALMVDAPAAIDNLRVMAQKRWIGRYGFFESIDYSGRGVNDTAPPRVVPLFMAHHQGMSLMALANAMFDGVMRKRFHSERLVLAAELLLQERLPKLIPDGEPELAGGLPAMHPQPAGTPPDREIAPASDGAVMPAS
jgi:cyclic beta-1,2-glucan synthetase